MSQNRPHVSLPEFSFLNLFLQPINFHIFLLFLKHFTCSYLALNSRKFYITIVIKFLFVLYSAMNDRVYIKVNIIDSVSLHLLSSTQNKYIRLAVVII